MKRITAVIKNLKGIKKRGGDVVAMELSTGIREATPMDKEFDVSAEAMGFVQRIPDGTFTMVIRGKRKQHEPNTGSKKRTGKKKGKKRSN